MSSSLQYWVGLTLMLCPFLSCSDSLASNSAPSGLPYSVTQEEAMKHGEVTRRLGRAIHCLKEASTIFLDEIFNAVDQLPYCLLYSAKVLKQALHDKFPDAPEKDVLKVSMVKAELLACAI